MIPKYLYKCSKKDNITRCASGVTEFFTGLITGNFVTTGKSINFVETYYLYVQERLYCSQIQNGRSPRF